MIQTEWIKLAIDVGLLLSLVLFGLRMVKSSGPRVNLGRMTELEGSMRGLLREADHGSRALTDQLVRRQKDLEKLLFDIETIEGRLNRQITQAEERKGALEIVTGRAESLLRGLERNDNVGVPRSAPTPATPYNQSIMRNESVKSWANPDTLMPLPQPEVMVEPPSFDVVMEPRARIPQSRKRKLSERVEREVTRAPQQQDTDESSDSEVTESLEAVSERAADARLRARDLQRNSVLQPGHVPSKLEPLGETRMTSVLSPEEARSASIEDPRLGVLTAPVIRRQTQVL